MPAPARAPARAPAPTPARRIDALMERASRALVATRYFECERLCRRAIALARRCGDFERLGRAVLPLQEARRQKRQAAFDAGVIGVFDRPGHLRRKARPGCVLIAPPLTPAAAHRLRAAADEAGVCVVAIARQAGPERGKWAIAAASDGVAIRASLPAPGPRRRTAAPGPALSTEWFAAAAEALSKAALASLPPGATPSEQVDGLLALLEAHPDNEILHAALHAACQRCHATGPR